MLSFGRSLFSRDPASSPGKDAAQAEDDAAGEIYLTENLDLAGDATSGGGGGGASSGSPFENLLVPIDDLDLADTADFSSNDFAQLITLLPEQNDKCFGPKGLNLVEVMTEVMSVLEACDETIGKADLLDYRWIADMVQFARDFIVDPMIICGRYRYLDLMGRLGERQAASQLNWDELDQATKKERPVADAAAMIRAQDRLMLMFNRLLHVNKQKRQLAVEIRQGCQRTCSALATIHRPSAGAAMTAAPPRLSPRCGRLVAPHPTRTQLSAARRVRRGARRPWGAGVDKDLAVDRHDARGAARGRRVRGQVGQSPARQGAGAPPGAGRTSVPAPPPLLRPSTS